MKIVTALLCAAAWASMAQAAKTLDVYDIDVEGGKCAPIVSPSRESMVIDVGSRCGPAGDGRQSSRLEANRAVATQRWALRSRQPAGSTKPSQWIRHTHAGNSSPHPAWLAQFLKILGTRIDP
jgi:hypothetical protein